MAKLRPTFVYRALNALNIVIYIGITKLVRKRPLLVGETARVEIISTHWTRREARHVEADLIQWCRPRWNYQHPKPVKLLYRCQRCDKLWSSWMVLEATDLCEDCQGVLVPV
jgi:excinuclease UvrABC nuclease subunit